MRRAGPASTVVVVAAAIALALLLLAILSSRAADWGNPPAILFAMMALAAGGALAICVAVATTNDIRELRIAWLLMAVAMAAQVIGALWEMVLTLDGRTTNQIPIWVLTAPAIGLLAAFPAVATYPPWPYSHERLANRVMDALLVGIACAAVGPLFVSLRSPSAEPASQWTAAAAVLSLVGSSSLLAGWVTRRDLRHIATTDIHLDWLAAAGFFTILGTFGTAVELLEDGANVNRWPMLALLPAFVCVVAAGLNALRTTGLTPLPAIFPEALHYTGSNASRWRLAGPYIAAASLAAVLAYAQIVDDADLPGSVIGLADVALVLVILRQLLAHAEHDQVSRNLRSAQGELARQATSDPITDLPNHRALIARLEEEVERARRLRQPLSLNFIDIDAFKTVNDTYGHQTGDHVLRELGSVLKSTVRSIDYVGRYAGEEFVVIVPGTWTDEALHLAERMRQAVAQYPFRSIDNVEIRLSVSIGVAGLPEHARTLDSLLRRADQALYSAKWSGRNQVWLFDPSESQPRLGAGTVEAAQRLAKLVERRDPHLANHAEAVRRRSVALARGIGVDPAEVHRIQTAALLHNIGKISIPDAILTKTDSLSHSEIDALRSHPLIGARILEGVPELLAVVSIVRHHHERWDGQGYPDGLSGQDIPLGSRILSIVDAYEAMTSPRAYRPGRSRDGAIAELRSCAGTHFDPDLVEPFVTIVAEEPDRPFSAYESGGPARRV